jgi:hypothetical protein
MKSAVKKTSTAFKLKRPSKLDNFKKKVKEVSEVPILSTIGAAMNAADFFSEEKEEGLEWISYLRGSMQIVIMVVNFITTILRYLDPKSKKLAETVQEVLESFFDLLDSVFEIVKWFKTNKKKVSI